MPKYHDNSKSFDTPKGPQGSEAAARNYVRAHLGWLHGFPLVQSQSKKLYWARLPPSGSKTEHHTISVTRELLRRSIFSRNAARRKFPRALPKIVGDVDLWTRHTDERFDILKAVVQFGAPLPQLQKLLDTVKVRHSLAQRIVNLQQRHSDITPLLRALIWLHWRDEPSLLGDLSVVEQHSTTLTGVMVQAHAEIDLLFLMQIVQLLKTGDKAFLDVLADRRSWHVPLCNEEFPLRLKRALRKIHKGKKLDHDLSIDGFDRPKAQLGDELVEFVKQLVLSPVKTHEGQLRLLAMMQIENALDNWQVWWSEAAILERDVRKMLGLARHHRKRIEKHKLLLLEKQINNLNERTPTAFRLHQLMQIVAPLRANTDPKVMQLLLDCVFCLKGEPKARHAQQFLTGWSVALRHCEKRPTLIIRLLKAQHALLQSPPFDENAKESQQKQQWVCQQLIEDLADAWFWQGRPHSLIDPALRTLAVLLEDPIKLHSSYGPFADYGGWSSLIDCLELISDPSEAAMMLKAVPPGSRKGLREKSWRALLRLSDLDPDKFKALAKQWRSKSWSSQTIEELDEAVKQKPVAELMIKGLLNGQSARLPRLMARSSLARSLKLSCAPPSSSELGHSVKQDFDLSIYPIELHDLLHELGHFDADPCHAADQILGRDFPSPKKLQGELVVLGEMVRLADKNRQPVLQARIVAIKRALAIPSPASPQRLENLRAKLKRRIVHARLSLWEEAQSELLKAGLEKNIGTMPKNWLEDENIMAVLSGLSDLPGTSRKLAFRLLKIRCGPQPWDLRDDPQNRVFLTALERQGINITPWLEGLQPQIIETSEKRLTLAMDPDPLEVMQMGAAFETCLSPGSFNFFSAISNAADINKQVLFARDDKGVVQARCLLALTTNGHILTFNIYAHSDYKTIENAIKDYINRLAAAMGTMTIARGNVPLLVAGDWYDDGPRDLADQLAFLKPDASFVKSLNKMKPADIYPALEQVLEGRQVTPYIICRLIETRALTKRPELAQPLLSNLACPGTLNALDPWCRINLASLARRAGERSKALDLLRPIIRKLPNHHDYYHLEVRISDELIKLDLPHRAFQLIRQTRPNWVKSWRDDSTDRLMVAAHALKKLYRPTKALKLYKIAKEHGLNDADAYINELEKQLDQSSKEIDT